MLNGEKQTSRRVKFGEKELKGLLIFMDNSRANCASCHMPPAFTDGLFHNIGVSEFDYRDVHGKFPVENNSLVKSITDYTNEITAGGNLFNVFPNKQNPSFVDLGRAGITRNPEHSFAFRTPAIRNLAYCAPYLHSGRAKTIADAVYFHITASSSGHLLKKSGKLAPFTLSRTDVDYIIAFIDSLNDYYE